jgi:hypothetical protein
VLLVSVAISFYGGGLALATSTRGATFRGGQAGSPTMRDVGVGLALPVEFPHLCRVLSAWSGFQPSPLGRGCPATALSSAVAGRVRGYFRSQAMLSG